MLRREVLKSILSAPFLAPLVAAAGRANADPAPQLVEVPHETVQDIPDKRDLLQRIIREWRDDPEVGPYCGLRFDDCPMRGFAVGTSCTVRENFYTEPQEYQWADMILSEDEASIRRSVEAGKRAFRRVRDRSAYVYPLRNKGA